MLMTIKPILSCDVCGCSIGNGFSTILPQFNKNFVGLRGSYARFNSHHVDDYQKVNHDKSTSMELWGRFYIHKRIQLLATLPYNIRSRQEEGITTTMYGFGDASLSVNYTLINKNADSLKYKHLLLIGYGIKFPTGKHDAEANSSLANIYLQPGSGAFDYLFNLLYTIRRNRLGFSNDLQYRYCGENLQQYSFGNKYSLSSRLFYWKKLGRSCNFLPSAGVIFEKYDKDLNKGYIQEETGGYINSLSLGCELYYKRIFLSINYNQPVNQHLGNGNIQSLAKIQLNTSFVF